MMAPLAWYNGACSYALAGNSVKALELLERALATGHFRDRDAVRRDPDLVSLAEDPRFGAIVGAAPPTPGPAAAPQGRAN